MEDIPGIDEESVLALVGELREANPEKRTFTLLEIADALGWARDRKRILCGGNPYR